MARVLGSSDSTAMPVLYAMGGLINPWISGGLHHLALAMLGGTTRPYSSTVRVVAYASATQIFAWVPGLGGLAALGLNVISMVMGLDETHKCGMGKAVAAVLLPWVLFGVCCCGCYLLMFVGLSAAGVSR